jgi:K+-sensing histidine kinase KdpD
MADDDKPKPGEIFSYSATNRAALVADLLATQSNHIASLKWAVGILESKITLRNSLAEVQAEALRDPFKEVLSVLTRIRDSLSASGSDEFKKFSREIESGISEIRKAVDSIGEWLASSTDPTILYPREALQRVSLKDVVNRALSDLGPAFDRSRLELVMPSSSTMITTAPARLAAIITQLLDNASKHGGVGRIECVCSITAQQDLKVIVRDRGPGLKGVDPEEYFRPKPQGSFEQQEWAPLLGLGLFLTRMMCESLGGTITLGEREGGGAVATVILPQRRRRDVVLEDARA